MRPTRLLVPCLVLLAALAPPSRAAKGPKASDIMLPAGFAPLTEAEKTLTSVPFAPGATAVVLLDAEQYQWEENFVRTRFERRVKILTDGGLDEGNFSQTYRGEWRINSMRARTILPDGTEVDATPNLHVESSKDPDITSIKVTFPKVQKGAIVDFSIDANANYVSLSEFIPQEDIPVLESRLLLVPAPGLRYRTAFAHMKPEEAQSLQLNYGANDMFAWIFKNVPPLPDVPNMPPRGEISKKLVLIKESYRYGEVLLPLAADWPSYCKDMTRSWDEWLKKHAGKCAALGVQVAGTAATPRDKAEAVRKALRERMTASLANDWPDGDNPDESLAAGKGYTADIAGVAVAMLRGAGVDARIAAYRHRSSGILPTAFPAPSMFDDVLVMVPGAGAGGKDLYFAASSDLPVGVLPEEALGVFVVPFVKDSKGPELLAEVPADENLVERGISLELSLDGTVKGEAMITAKGPSGQDWRAALKRLSADDRKKYIEDHLRRTMPTAVLGAWQAEGIDDASKDIVLTLAWEAPGLAQKAGDRMLLNPFVFARVAADDWGAETREQDIWLGRPYARKDSVTLKMPQGIKAVQLPAPAKLEAPNVGGYVSSYSGKEMTLMASRQIRFEQTLFPASSWAPLRSWFQDMAKADDQSIVFTLAEEMPQ